MTRKKLAEADLRDQILASQAVRWADSAVKLLAAARELGVERQALTPFPVRRAERTMLATLGQLPDSLRSRLAGSARKFLVAEAVSMVTAVSECFPKAASERQPLMRQAAEALLYCIHRDVLVPAWEAQAKTKEPTRFLYQLKVTLLGAKPAIWRRIQVKDCTLDRLHEYIQTVMGWTNSHLHHFDVGGQLYGDPQLMGENFHAMNYRDSIITLFSSVLPADNRRFRFRYMYDFGDQWEHEILFEGCPNPHEGAKYPVCVEGERACPPEDVGGVAGYAEFLGTITNRQQKERVEMLEWADGWFDPDEFDATTATKSMWKGIVDWRNEE